MVKRFSAQLKSPWTWLNALINIEVFAVIGWWAQKQIRTPNIGPVERGRMVAVESVCFAYHGSGENGGVFNPNADINEMPAWSGKKLMMYAKTEDEICKWVLDGAPKWPLDRLQNHC